MLFGSETEEQGLISLAPSEPATSSSFHVPLMSSTSSNRPAMRLGPIPFARNVRGAVPANGGNTSGGGVASGVERNYAATASDTDVWKGLLGSPGQAGAVAAARAGNCADDGGRGDPAASTPSSTISEDLLRMFQEGALADVEVICTCGGGCKLQAHRLVLAARSPVFKAMFLMGMREKRVGKVVIDDCFPEAITCMLDYAYKDECPGLNDDTIFDVLKIANKYDMPGLRDICLDFMAQNSHSDNVDGFLVACDTYNLTEFKHLLLTALVDNPPALHECVHGQGLDSHPGLMKQLLSLCAHRLACTTKERNSVRHFDGLPYRSRCYVCVREVAAMSKQMLGEMLFPMVQKICPEHANKITGMIIELGNSELVPLFESECALREKVKEAVVVLRAAEDTPARRCSCRA